MKLYHGTTLVIERPEIIRQEVGRDFGAAFYTTDIQAQAERWAVRQYRVRSRKGNRDLKPMVNVYEWSDDGNIDIKSFPDATMEWLEWVVQCRSDTNYHHGYDVVIGKIANDNVGETISYVLQGIMRKEDALERLKFQEMNNQYAFCTEKALASLVYVESYEVKK